MSDFARQQWALTLAALLCVAQPARGADGGTVALTAIPTASADAGTALPAPFSSPIYAGCPATDELAVRSAGVDGGSGWFLPDARASLVACRAATCDAKLQMDEGTKPVPLNVPALTTIAVVVTAVVAAGAGFVVGYFVKH